MSVSVVRSVVSKKLEVSVSTKSLTLNVFDTTALSNNPSLQEKYGVSLKKETVNQDNGNMCWKRDFLFSEISALPGHL